MSAVLWCLFDTHIRVSSISHTLPVRARLTPTPPTAPSPTAFIAMRTSGAVACDPTLRQGRQVVVPDVQKLTHARSCCKREKRRHMTQQMQGTVSA